MSQSGKQVVDINDIYGGGARLVYADASEAKPTALSDILNTSTGVLASGWNDLGATDGGISLNRGFDKESWEVDQVLGVIDEFITVWNMSLETSLAENSLENFQVAWESGEITTDAGPTPSERTSGLGDPECLTERMIAFIVDKRKVSGTGYIKAYVFWKAQLDGADSAHAYTKGEKTLIPLTFKILADSTETDKRRFGIMIDQVVA
jgi:hypothetical protein